MRYTRLPAHVYEITTADKTTINSGTADQNPMTLCQLKSLALDGSPRLNQVTFRRDFRFQLRGHHR